MSANNTFLAMFLGSKTNPLMTAWNALPDMCGALARVARVTNLSTTPSRARLLLKELSGSEDFSAGRIPLKYMLTWTERPQGSPMEYENAQKRILEVFTQWKAPGNFKIELFVIRVGDWVGICCWTAMIRRPFTSSARCFLLLYSRHGPSFQSRMLSKSNLKRLPSATN